MSARKNNRDVEQRLFSYNKNEMLITDTELIVRVIFCIGLIEAMIRSSIFVTVLSLPDRPLPKYIKG